MSEKITEPVIAFEDPKGAESGISAPTPIPKSRPAPPSPAFAELGVTSNYSFLHGASHPRELVAEAARLGHAAIGIADPWLYWLPIIRDDA